MTADSLVANKPYSKIPFAVSFYLIYSFHPLYTGNGTLRGQDAMSQWSLHVHVVLDSSESKYCVLEQATLATAYELVQNHDDGNHRPNMTEKLLTGT